VERVTPLLLAQARARLLGIDDSPVTGRVQKALERLRQRLPGSVFAELG
jgi:hypothetical protein